MASYTVTTPDKEFKPEFKEQHEKSNEAHESYVPSDEPSKLNPQETEKEVYMRITRRVWHEMVPERQKYDQEMQEIQDAYEGLLRMSRDSNAVASKVFPLIFILVDAKLSTILASRPRAVFEHTTEKSKIPLIEMLYEFYTSDVDNGTDIEVVDYLWHWYNELYGWSIKRIWHEVDQWMEYEDVVETEENEEGEESIVYGSDGFANMTYARTLKRRSVVRQRVYRPDMVAVDPEAMFLFEANDIVFMEDMDYDEWSIKYKENSRFMHTDKVHPGMFMAPTAERLFASSTNDGDIALYNHSKANLGRNKVRVVEYYNVVRDEYAVFFNGILALHVPNPTPPVDGRKVLPAADLHNRLRPGSFYSRSEGKVTEPIVVMWQRLLNAKARRAELAASPVVLTDTPSGIAPKSFKVMPGAHWKGMKGRAETLNLAGVDTGEVREYIEILRDLAKVTTGVDFDRFIAEPDPTAQQQMAREAASQLRTAKDVRLQETLGHVRSMKITLANIQYYIPIPEIVNKLELSEEEAQELKDYDKIEGNLYYRYQKIPLKDKFFVQESYDENDGKISLKASNMNTVEVDDYFFARKEFVRTKSPVKVNAVSDKKQSQSKALRYELSLGILERAFGLPPKNEFEIQEAINQGQKPPKPVYYINRTKAVERYVDSAGEDVQEMTQADDASRRRPVTSMMEDIFGGKAPTLRPNEQQQQQLNQVLNTSKQAPSPVELSRAGVSAPTSVPDAVQEAAQQQA